MGSFVFKWPHPDAKDVHVTGTFDDWGKSEQLNKIGDTWEKEVELPSADQKYLYKFVVDDQWIIDHTAPQEDDGNHNVNNVLYPHQIKKKELKEVKEESSAATGVAAGAAGLGAAGLAAGIVPAISSAAPTSTASDLAAKVPLEEAREAVPAISSAAPISSTSDLAAKVPLEDAREAIPTISSAVPTGTTADLAAKAPLEEVRSVVPGAFPETPSNEPEAFSVAPIPASGSGVNPINLKPGEPVPPHSELTPHTVDSTATTSKEDYEKAGSSSLPIVGGAAAGLGVGAVTAAAATFAHGESKENLIPESSLPIGVGASDLGDIGPTLASAAPLATTAGLAAVVPLEKKRQAMVINPEDAPKGLDIDSEVPAAVKESVAESHASPEALASAEAVKEKSAVEQELLSKTPVSQAVGESASAAAEQTSYYGLATNVPKTVEESMAKAHAAPEAAAESSVVAEKSLLEKELLQKVPSTDEVGESAPTIAAATSATAPAVTAAETPATTAAETPATGAAATPGTKAAEAIGGVAAAVGGIAAAGAAAVGLSSGKKAEESGEKSAPAIPAAAKTASNKVNEAIGGATAAVGGIAASGAAAFGLSSGKKASEPVEKSVPGTSPPATTAALVDAPKTTALAEKTEAAITEQIPPRVSSAVPGVAGTAAAALSHGTTDQTLAEEPAVKMMNQNEAASTTPKAAISTPAVPAAVSTPVASKVAAPTTPATPAVSTSTPTAVSTPTKKVTDVASSSPATSSTKDKKKKHRVSSFFKKIFD